MILGDWFVADHLCSTLMTACTHLGFDDVVETVPIDAVTPIQNHHCSHHNHRHGYPVTIAA
jgi:hypothetical protein